MRTRVLVYANVLTVLVAVALCAAEKRLTILHTNDMHATFVPREASWVKQTPPPLIGGVAELSWAIDSLRKVRPATLLLDAGDVMTGNPISDRVYKGAKGGALFEMMNMIGYDAWCPGNHDLDISQKNLLGLTAIAQFPTLSANLVNDRGEFPLDNTPCTIIERGGLRVGLIGIMSQELSSLVNQNNLVGLRVLSPTETLQKYIDQQRDKTDLIVALTHQGANEDSALAAEVRGLNVIVGGHSHTRIKKPKVVNDVIIVQTGSNVENLGVLDLIVEDRRVVSHSGFLLPLWAGRTRPVTRIGKFADSLDAEIEKEYSVVLGTLEGDWVRSSSGVSAVGSYVTEAQRRAVAAEVGFMNIHGIRRDISAGPITKRELSEMLPFHNIMTTFQLTGRQLQDVLRYYVSKKPGILISGIDGECTLKSDGSVELRNITVQGKGLVVDRSYICTASDYFMGEAKRYLGFEVRPVLYLEQTLFQAVEKAIREDKVIVPHVKNRLILVR